MAKANKNSFRDLVERTTYTYTSKSGTVHEFPIRQLTVADLSEIMEGDEKESEIKLVRLSLEVDDISDIPIPAFRGIVETIIEFNDLDDLRQNVTG